MSLDGSIWQFNVAFGGSISSIIASSPQWSPKKRFRWTEIDDF